MPAIKKPNLHFDATLYTGASPTATSVTGIGFQPDFTWIKSRVTGYGHALFDSVRGATKRIQSDSIGTEATSATYLTSFDSGGFSVGSDYGQNAPGELYVSWNWKAGGAAVTNTAGVYTSQVSANPTAGFSVVTYTANQGNNKTVGHGLGVAPKMIIAKCRSAGNTNWVIYTEYTGKDYVLLFTTADKQSNASYWGSGGVTSTVFGVKDGAYDNNTGDMVAYCFAEVAGYSAFGSYTGNGSSDGPFVYLGFRPRWVMSKRTDSTGSWLVVDSSRNTYNVVNGYLVPNTSGAEGSATWGDFLSNGFKLRGTTHNGSGESYIYACFAENPFKYANAR